MVTLERWKQLYARSPELTCRLVPYPSVQRHAHCEAGAPVAQVSTCLRCGQVGSIFHEAGCRGQVSEVKFLAEDDTDADSLE
jgi:hypothetical protein